MKARTLSLLVIGACSLCAVHALAATYVWTQYGSGAYSWSGTGNWANGMAPPTGGAADAGVVLLPNSATLLSPGTRIAATNDLGSGGVFDLNSLSIKGWFNNSGSYQAPATFGTATYNLSGATLNFTGTNPTVYYHPSAYAATTPTFFAGNPITDIDCDINLAADTRFYTTDGGTTFPGLRLRGTISGPGRLTWDNQEYTGSFNLAVTGSNTFTGGVTVGNTSGGRAILIIASDASLGAAPGAPVVDNLRLAGRIQPLYTGDLTLNANRGVTLFGNGDAGGGFNGPTGGTGWTTVNGKITGTKYLAVSGNVRLTATTSDFGIPGAGKRGLWTNDTTIEVMKLADEGQPSSLGSTGQLWFDGGGGGTLRYLGSGDSTNRTYAGDKNMVFDASGTGPIDYTGLIDWSAGGGVTVTGPGSGASSGTLKLSGNHTLTKAGTGDWTISGATDFTGNTSATTVGNGRLTLDYRTVNTNRINAAAALTLGSTGAAATLAVQGSNSANTSQTVTATTLATDSGGTLDITSGTGAQNATLVLGAITRNNRSTLEVKYTNPGTGAATVTTTTANNGAGILGGWAVVKDAAGNANWATSSAGTIIGLAPGAYTGPLPTTGGAITDNDTLAGSQTQTGAVTVNSLRIAGGSSGQSLDLNGNSITFSSTGGGLLYAGGATDSYSIVNSGAAAYIGGGTANEFLVNVQPGATLTASARLIGSGTSGSLVKYGGGTLVVASANNYTGGTTVNGGTLKLGVANAIPGSTTFTLATGATFDLAGFSTGTGNVQGFGTITNSGGSDALLTIGNSGGAATLSGLVQDGATNRTAVTLNSNQAQTFAGLNTYTGVTTLYAGTLNVTNLADGGQPSGIGQSSSAAANLLLDGGTLGYTGTVNAATDRAMTLTTRGGGLASSGGSTSTTATFNGNIVASGAAGTQTLALSGTSIGVLNGTVANGSGTNVTLLTKSGTGTWVLNGANGYSGITTVNGGTLRATDSVGLPTASPLVISAGVFETGADFTRGLGTAAGNVRISGGTSGFSANGTAPATIAVGGIATPTALTWGSADFAPATLVLNEATANQNLTFANAVDLNSAAARTINVNATTGAAFMTGLITNTGGTGGLTKGGAGVLVLANDGNSYTGKTTVNQGMLSFTSISNVGGGNSALGNPSSVANGTIDLGSGTNTAALQYLGPAASTDRVINLSGTTGGVMIESSGSGPLTLTSSFTATGAGAKTLYLTGSTGGVIQGGIVNSASATAVAKAGTGVWELTGGTLNAFTGGLTVRSGVLRAREASIPVGGGFTLDGSNPNGIASVWESDQDIVHALNATPAAGTLKLVSSNGYAAAGFSARGANINVNLGGAAATVTWGANGFFTGSSQRLLLNESTADGTINFRNGINFNTYNSTQAVVVVNATGGDPTAATLSGVLSNGGLGKDGAGTLILANAGNSFTGGVTVYDGILRVGATGALPANALTVNAGTLDLAGANATATGTTALTLGGGAAGTTATVTTGTGTLTLGGNVTYNGQTAHANGATISGNLSLTGTRSFTVTDSLAAPYDLTVDAAISATGAFGLTKAGAGRLLLTGANTYTGATTTGGGDFRVGGIAGALQNTSGIILSAATTFTIDNTAAALSDRVANTAGYTMNQGAEIRFIGNDSTSVNETAGALGTNDGRMTLTLAAGSGAGASITFASLSRPYGQTFLVRGSNLGQGSPGTAGVANLLFADILNANGLNTYLKGGTGGAGTTTQKVVTFMVGDTSATGLGSDLVTYDAANGVRPLRLAAGEYQTSIAGASSTSDNVRLAGSSETVAASTTINALLLTAGGGVALGNGVTLTVGSGVITPVGDNVAISGGGATGGLASLGGNPILVNATRDMTISSRITGTLYKGGPATLTLAGQLTGIDRMLGGVLRMGAPNVLPSGGTVSANGGGFLLDLNGNDQLVAATGGWTAAVTNTSATAATLTTSSGLQGTITGNLNIKYTGAGTLSLNGGSANNAWSGWTQITDGTFQMSGGHYISPWTVLRLGDTDNSSGKFDLVNGADQTVAGLTTVGAGAANTVTSTTTGTRVLTVRTLGADWSFPGIIQNGSGTQITGFAKAGLGTQTLSGANTYTGATTVSGGTLELDYTSQDNAKIAPGAALTLGGGTLRIVGNSYTQSVLSTTVAAGASGVTQASGSTQLNLNAFTRSMAGGTVDFNVAGGAAAITTDTNDTNGILGGWATFGGSDWAQSVNSGAADTAITAYSGYNTGSNPAAWAATDNVSLSGSPAAPVVGPRAVNSLRFTGAADLTIAGVQSLTLASGGLLVTGNGAVNITGGGTLKGSGTAPRDLVLIQNSTADLTIGAPIEDNGGATALTKSGSGRLLLNGNNVYTGATYVNSGTVVLGHTNALGTTTAGTTVFPGATLDLNGQALPAEAFTVGGPGAGGAGALINSSTTPVALAGTVTLSGYDASIGGTGTLVLNGAVGGTGGGTGGTWVSFVKTGPGTVVLNAANTYAGPTRVDSGTLTVNGSIGGNGVFVAAGAALSGTGTVNGGLPFAISGAGLVSPGASPGILTTGTIDASQGLDFAFEFSRLGGPNYALTTASGNDVLRLTGGYPFPFPLTTSNTIDVYVDLTSVNTGDTLAGGFYADNYGDFLSRIEDATYTYYVRGDGAGPFSFNGINYYLMSSYYPMLVASLETVAATAAFASGTANGYVTQWSFVIPEPSALLLVAGAALLLNRRRCV